MLTVGGVLVGLVSGDGEDVGEDVDEGQHGTSVTNISKCLYKVLE